jgi:hypothetical protein
MTKINTMKPFKFSQFDFNKMTRLHNTFIKYKMFNDNRWPMVFWGNREDSDKPYEEDEKPDLPQYCDKSYNLKYQLDYLGVYRHHTHTEGFIELYGDRIFDCAKSIASSLKIDIDTTYGLLTTIVLLHELGHWYTHWCIKDNRNERQIAYCIIAKDKFITETMAQLAVIWGCETLENQTDKTMLFIMDYLANNQPPPYTIYKKIGKAVSLRSKIQKRYLKLLDLKSIDKNYLLFYSKNPAKIAKNKTDLFAAEKSE